MKQTAPMTMNAELLRGVLGGRKDAHVDSLLDAVRVCARCDMQYTERENMAAWRCAAFHPHGDDAQVGRAKYYSCCGKQAPSRGCVRADHTDEFEYDVDGDALDPRIASAIRAKFHAQNAVRGTHDVVDPTRLFSDNNQWKMQRIDRDAALRAEKRANSQHLRSAE